MGPNVNTSVSKMNEPNEVTMAIPLNWLRILAGLSYIIGMGGLVALMVHNGWAQDRRGTDPSKPFNPYAPPPRPGTPSGDYFDDEAEEDFEVDDGFAGAPPSGRGGGNQGAAGGDEGYQPSNGGGISVGGSTVGGIISAEKEPPAARVDDEGAVGSKEVITDFNFPDADILDIAKALGKLTGKNFLLDKDVKGRITIISNSPVTVADAWRAFLTSLDMNGFALIPSGKFIRIARQRDARDKQLKTYTGDYSPDTDALITRLFPLKYLSAEEVARNFRSFMPANSRIIPYEQTNTVIVTDTGSNIAKLNKLLEILDVEGYDAGIEVIPVKHASAVELSKLIDTLIPGTPSAAPGGGPRFGGAAARFTARRTKEGGIINTIIADERTNNLIVHANQRGADQVRELLSKLDKKVPIVTGGGKVHVVYLQFADAEQIGTTLNNLSQAAATGLRPVTPAGGTGTGTGVNPVQATLFEGSIKVSPDKATNSLVITASPSDFLTIQRVINQLDIPRDQVYAEVVIMEVTIGRDFNFSTNVINPSNGIGFLPNQDLLGFLSNPLATKGAVLGFKAGQETTIRIAGRDEKVSGVQGLIKAIQTNSKANVLATPQILTLDNTEATFETAELIPLPTTNAIQGAGVATSITKERVSLAITIKPQINKLSNFVKLDINAKLADITRRELPSAVASLALATSERNAKTSIVVADEDTVVLGGLVRDKQEDVVSKIPILGDIPLLGWLFRSKESSSAKTNLLIFITPKIIRQYESIRTVLDQKLKERDEFLERNTGGDDTMRPYRDNIIRRLPDMKKILSSKPQRFKTIDSGVDESGETALERMRDQNARRESTLAPNPGQTQSGSSLTAPNQGSLNPAQPAIPNTGTPAPQAENAVPPEDFPPPAEFSEPTM